MKLFVELLPKKYIRLQITIIVIVIFLILIINIFSIIFFKKSINNAIFDMLISLVVALFFMTYIFKLILKKEEQQEVQINQLTEAYQYIGQINRKIDALLELDIASLDHSTKRPIHETASGIFRQLVSLVSAKAGFLYLEPPFEFKMHIENQKNFGIKNALEILAKSKTREFRHSQGKENEDFFNKLGMTNELLKKFDFLIKPVYMHQQDIGTIILLFNKNQSIEDRDLNIIRVFSFYLALNATFKPDFSKYQT